MSQEDLRLHLTHSTEKIARKNEFVVESLSKVLSDHLLGKGQRTFKTQPIKNRTSAISTESNNELLQLKIVVVGTAHTRFQEVPRRQLNEVLQKEDIALCESVQKGMETPAFTQGRIVSDPSGSGLSEHAVHHFHGLVLDAYKSARSQTHGTITTEKKSETT